MGKLTRRDVATIAVLAFFFVLGMTVELYFLVEHRRLPENADHNFIARMFQIYAPADRAYYAPVSSLALALELINVGVTQPLGIVLVVGILKRRTWRWPLQLAVGSYLSYSLVLYFLDAQVSGYANMADKTAANLAIFYGANLPWLIGYAWLALDAGREILARLNAAATANATSATANATSATANASAPAIEQGDRVAPVVEKLG